ncbi:MAG: methyltransferase [Flavobacteriaceae bacterium]|nr:methyltransferase [Flavobacteriaceae bacterium]
MHQNDDVYTLALMKSPFPDVEMRYLIQQIQGRQIAQKKFPTLQREGMIFPARIHLEQTSSEATAIYKSQLVQGHTLADITGGFGIDSIFFSKRFETVYHIEHNIDLQKIAQENFKTLQYHHIQSYSTDGMTFLKSFKNSMDVIYIDPSRRDASQKKVFLLQDLQPEILKILPDLMGRANTILIKLSPLIDISYLLDQFNFTKYACEIHVVAVRNEVKEILVKLGANSTEERMITAVNLESNDLVFTYDPKEILSNKIEYADASKFIYEPNSALLKSGGGDVLANRLGLKKFHPNTHLYSSDDLLENYPGRVFKLLNKLTNPKKELKNKSIMAVHRNFPENLKTLKNKYSFHTDGTLPILFASSVKKVYMNYLEYINFNK